MSRELARVKGITLLVFYSTVLSVCLLLGMKYIEIDDDYPREHFCVTCPDFPIHTYPRQIENNIDFNLFMFLDFSTLMLIVLIFGSADYYKHPNYLFVFHIARFMSNLTHFSNTEIIGQVLKPMFHHNCILSSVCTDRRVLPHVTVALMYLAYFTIMMTNFGITFLLTMCYDPSAETRNPPVIVRAPHLTSRGRPYFRFDLSSPFATKAYSSYNRSPSPSKMVVIPTSVQTKYHRLESCDSPTRHSKNKVLPYYIQETKHQIVD